MEYWNLESTKTFESLEVISNQQWRALTFLRTNLKDFNLNSFLLRHFDLFEKKFLHFLSQFLNFELKLIGANYNKRVTLIDDR